MSQRNFKDLEQKIFNRDIPAEEIKCTDKEWGYATGWLWSILMDLQPYTHDNLMIHVNKKRSLLNNDTVALYEKVNAKLLEDDWKTKRLLVVVFGGFVNRKDEPDELSKEVKECIILGYNTIRDNE